MNQHYTRRRKNRWIDFSMQYFSHCRRFLSINHVISFPCAILAYSSTDKKKLNRTCRPAQRGTAIRCKTLHKPIMCYKLQMVTLPEALLSNTLKLPKFERRAIKLRERKPF